MPDAPVRPDYSGASVSSLVPALLGSLEGTEEVPSPSWLPAPVTGAEAVVLLVLDGTGWTAVDRARSQLPVLGSLEGGPATTVVPSTTAAALSSIATGMTPSRHGIFGYRMRVGGAVLDVLQWKVPEGRPPAPSSVTSIVSFAGRSVPVVTRADFARSGFTEAHMRGARFLGWRTLATLVTHVSKLVAAGERFVYAYYDGVDKVAHEYGLSDGFFAAELAATDRLVGDVLDALPPEAALVVTADHGQVPFARWIRLDPLAPMVAAYAGDARFRYLYARPGATASLARAAAEELGDDAWVFTRDQLVDEGWLGPEPPAGDHLSRIGDVALAARGEAAFVDPTHLKETRLAAGHGSLTADEMLVPIIAGRGRAPA
ncbi:MAG: alkaline phosphatase family protein [Acidimicrobiia bacterium]